MNFSKLSPDRIPLWFLVWQGVKYKTRRPPNCVHCGKKWWEHDFNPDGKVRCLIPLPLGSNPASLKYEPNLSRWQPTNKEIIEVRKVLDLPVPESSTNVRQALAAKGMRAITPFEFRHFTPEQIEKYKWALPCWLDGYIYCGTWTLDGKPEIKKVPKVAYPLSYGILAKYKHAQDKQLAICPGRGKAAICKNCGGWKPDHETEEGHVVCYMGGNGWAKNIKICSHYEPFKLKVKSVMMESVLPDEIFFNLDAVKNSPDFDKGLQMRPLSEDEYKRQVLEPREEHGEKIQRDFQEALSEYRQAEATREGFNGDWNALQDALYGKGGYPKNTPLAVITFERRVVK